MRIIVLYYKTTQSSAELWPTMITILFTSILLFRSITCRIGHTEIELELFERIEETFDKDVFNHESLDRYIHELSYWKLGQFEKFCQFKGDSKDSLFCTKIFKRFHNLEENHRKDMVTRSITPRVKRDIFEEEDNIESFVTDIVHELKVQYVVIMAEESQVTNKRKKVLKKILKNFSKHGIRLSVETLGKMNQNITKLLPITSADRPCMFYLMGDSSQIIQKVIRINMCMPLYYFSYIRYSLTLLTT